MKLSMVFPEKVFPANAVLVDANIWIAFFLSTDVHADKATTILEKEEKKGSIFLIPQTVIQETITFLLYKNHPETAATFIQYLQGSRIIRIQEDFELMKNIFLFASEHHFRPKISFTDWSLYYLSAIHNIKLLTLDRQLTNAIKSQKF